MRPTAVKTLDGAALPVTPKSIVHSLKQISLDASQDVSGNLQETFLGEKDVITITFTMLEEVTLRKIKKMLRKRYITVVHEDYWDYTIYPDVTEIMYHSDLETSPYWIKANRDDSLYQEYSFELISKNTRRVDYI